jgi:hypothetical protein
MFPSVIVPSADQAQSHHSEDEFPDRGDGGGYRRTKPLRNSFE